MSEFYFETYEPEVTSLERQYVDDALRSGWVSAKGRYLDRMQALVQEALDIATKPVLTSSCTAAMQLITRAIQLETGHAVLVTDCGFISGANMISYTGAMPVFIGPSDVKPTTKPEDFFRFFESQCIKKSGRFYLKETNLPIHAILFTHLYGFVTDLTELAEFCLEHKIWLVEDAAQSLLSCINGKFAGTFGDFGCFSFNGNKLVTTGTGGAIIGKDASLLLKLERLNYQSRVYGFEYQYDDMGYNLQMSHIQAAVGVGQLERIKQTMDRKLNQHQLYKKYILDQLGDFGEVLTQDQPGFLPWVNIFVFQQKHARETLKHLANLMQGRKVAIRPVFPPISAYSMYKNILRFNDQKNTELFDRAICLPSSVFIQKEQVEYVIVNLKECIESIYE